MNIEELADISGDARLHHFTYSDGKLSINLILDDGSEAMLELPTEAIMTTRKPEDIPAVCYVAICDLDNTVAMKNGIYVPPDDFPTLIKQVRAGLSLSYGKRASECTKVIQLKSNTCLLAAIVSSLDDVKCSVL